MIKSRHPFILLCNISFYYFLFFYLKYKLLFDFFNYFYDQFFQLEIVFLILKAVQIYTFFKDFIGNSICTIIHLSEIDGGTRTKGSGLSYFIVDTTLDDDRCR